MSSFGFFSGLSRLLLSTYVIIAAMLCCRIQVCFRGLFVMFSSL